MRADRPRPDDLTEMMLLPAAITVAFLHAAAAADFLDGCPFDRGLLIGDDRVVDVLETFYKDLVFVRAATTRRHVRSYSGVLREIRELFAANQLPSLIEHQVHHRVQMLANNQITEALGTLRPLHWNMREQPQVRSYLQYFIAEALRLMGSVASAASQVLDAIGVRQQSTGVPVSDLERLDGLVTLQRVSQFNQQAERSYRLRGESPNYRMLSVVHMVLKDELAPLNELRSSLVRRLFETSPSLGGADVLVRTSPHLDDFNGQSVSKRAVEGILCEFARKLQILGVSSYRASPIDYGDVMLQLRQVAPDFADRFYESVVKNIENGNDQEALDYAESYWSILELAGSTTMVNLTARGGYEVAKVVEVFARFFRIEIYRRAGQRCMHLAKEIEFLMELIRDERMTRSGISWGKIIEMEGSIVFLWLSCFHRRVKSAYELEGDEDEEQLAQKRRQYGTSQRIIPTQGWNARQVSRGPDGH